MDLAAVGKRIKQVRERHDMTQEELAEKVDISASHMSVVERGKKGVKVETLVNIANALDVSPNELLQDVAIHAQTDTANELTAKIMRLPADRRAVALNVLKALVDESAN